MLVVLASVLIAALGLQPHVVNPFDACFFVGARFAHAHSMFYGTECTGLHLRDDWIVEPASEGETLPAQTAVALATELLEEVSRRQPCGPNLFPQEAFEQGLVALKAIGSGLRIDGGVALKGLKSANEELWRYASCYWSDWQREVQISDSPIDVLVKGQLKAFSAFVIRSLRGPYWHAQQRALVAAAAFYFYDLCALAGRWSCYYTPRASAGALLVGAQPLFRPIHQREFRTPVLLSNWRDWLVDTRDVEENLPMIIQTFVRPDSLAAWAARSVVAGIVCGDAVSFLEARPEVIQDFGPTWPVVKMGVNLIHLCGTDGDMKAVRDWLSNQVIAPPLPYRNWRLDHEVGEYLGQEELEVGRGLQEGSTVEAKAERALELLENVLDQNSLVTSVIADGRESTYFGVATDPFRRQLFTGLGRAMGLAVRYGLDLKMLNLAPALVPLLHPRQRARISQAEVSAVIQALGVPEDSVDSIAQSVELISHAIDEGLGPGGFALISDVAWLALFTA